MAHHLDGEGMGGGVGDWGALNWRMVSDGEGESGGGDRKG